MTDLIIPEMPLMPSRIAALPRDPWGFPIFWSVARDQNGSPDHSMPADGMKMVLAARHGQCWTCGEPTGRYRCYVVDPLHSLTRTSDVPPSHLDCATFIVQCQTSLDLLSVWTTQELTYGRRTVAGLTGRQGMTFDIGKPTSVAWWLGGRPATRDEIVAAINAALPDLVAKAEEGTEREQVDLLSAVKQVTDFLPA